MLGRLNSDIAMTKALQYVQLKELAKQQDQDLEELLKDVDKMYAQYVYQGTNAFEKIIQKTHDPDKPDSWIQDLLSSSDDKNQNDS